MSHNPEGISMDMHGNLDYDDEPDTCEFAAYDQEGNLIGGQIHNPHRYQVNQSPPSTWPSAELMMMQQCGLGYHAWLPWLAVQHPDHGTISFYWTKCVRCGAQEQYDL